MCKCVHFSLSLHPSVSIIDDSTLHLFLLSTVLAMNTNRRTYRGQNRPTDGNIPHSLSRRNRASRSEARQRSNALAADRRRAREAARDVASDSDRSDDDSIDDNDGHLHVEGSIDVADSSMVHAEKCDQGQSDSLVSSLESDVGVEDNGMSDELSDEIKHVKRRLRNVQESIQTSTSIVNPVTWEQNCLNAVANCINEWRSIVVRYFRDGDVQLNEETMLAGKETSLAVFGLLQLTMQSGPLAGSNPGYFKRCGGDVARVALKFLESDVLTSGDLSSTLLFSAKQVDVIGKWRKNAAKAVENNKPPSKSMLKLQQGKGKASAKKEKKVANTKRSR